MKPEAIQDPMYSAFLRECKRKIAVKELRQGDVGKRLGMSNQNVCLILNGRVMLRADRVFRLAKLLGISIDRILDFEKRTAKSVKKEKRAAIETLDDVFERSKMPYENYERLYKAINAIGGTDD